MQRQNPLKIAHELLAKGQLEQASALLKQVLAAQPNNAEALWLFGKALIGSGKFQLASKQILKALTFAPNNPNVHFELAVCQMYLHQYEDAMRSMRETLKILPEHMLATRELGNVLLHHGRLSEAAEVLALGTHHHPKEINLWLLLGNTLGDLGRFDESIECFKVALNLNKGVESARSSILMRMNYIPTIPPSEIYELSKKYGEMFERGSPKINPPDAAAKTIRIGYVSSNLNSHSVAYFLKPLLSNHDCSKVEVYIYDNTNHCDEMTEAFKGLGHHWRPIRGLSDDRVVQVIVQDKIQVLIDVISHTGGSRLGVFAQAPAPIQVTWLAYPNTTGVKEIQYRFTDEIADPQGLTESYYTEELVRLPKGFLCYEFPSDLPCRREPPYTENGYVTFGSFNNLNKITASTISAWSEILKGVPGSKILVKSRQLVDPAVRDNYSKLFAECGIGTERIEFRGAVSGKDSHLKMYDEIDLALDSFPYNGTTTTCEALWMGVPTITYTGQVHASRVSASIMHHAGLNQFVADSLEQYIELAVKLGNQPLSFSDLRPVLRARLNKSALADGAGFADQVESAYLNLIERHRT